MIGTAREYGAAKRQIKELETALQALKSNRGSGHPDIERALLEGYTGELSCIRDDVERYDAVRSGQTRSLQITSLAELGEAVVLARTAAGRTQRELADELGVSAQQIQRDEAKRYAKAGIDRLQAVMGALQLKFEGNVTLVRVLDQPLGREPSDVQNTPSSAPPFGRPVTTSSSANSRSDAPRRKRRKAATPGRGRGITARTVPAPR